MKKKVSILFIALAAVMLLVSGIVPHHHHDGVACMIVEHCGKDNSVNDRHTNHPVGDIQHEPSCVAESDYTPYIDSRTKCKISSCDHCGSPNHIHLFSILYLAADFLPYSAETASASPEYGEYALFYKSAETSRFHGLRAPPFILS